MPLNLISVASSKPTGTTVTFGQQIDNANELFLLFQSSTVIIFSLKKQLHNAANLFKWSPTFLQLPFFRVALAGKKIEMENHKKWYGAKPDTIEAMKRYFN